MDEPVRIDENELGNFYWKVIDDARRERRCSWETLAKSTHLARNSIAVARSRGRTLGFEETVRMCVSLELPVNNLCPFFLNHVNDDDIPSVDFSVEESLSSRFWTVMDIIRKAAGKSWEDVSRECGVKRSTISTARSYRRSLPFYKHCLICNVFHLSMGAVVSLITDKAVEDSTLSARLLRLSQKNLQLISDLVDIMLSAEEGDK